MSEIKNPKRFTSAGRNARTEAAMNWLVESYPDDEVTQRRILHSWVVLLMVSAGVDAPGMFQCREEDGEILSGEWYEASSATGDVFDTHRFAEAYDAIGQRWLDTARAS